MRPTPLAIAVVLSPSPRSPAPRRAPPRRSTRRSCSRPTSRAASTTRNSTLQRHGYAAAIVSDKLIEAIRSGPHGAIALAYVEWAGEGEQTIVVDWTVLRNPTDAREIRRRADRFAALLPRPHRDRLGARFRHGAVRRGRDRRRPQGDRRLRRRNQQPRAARLRKRATRRSHAGAVDQRPRHLQPPRRRAGRLSRVAHQPARRARRNYYRDNVVGGPGAFVLPIDDFSNFGDAMIRKLTAEIASRRLSAPPARRLTWRRAFLLCPVTRRTGAAIGGG